MDNAQEKEFLRKLGVRIRHLRDERSLSQDRLANECDMTQTYLSQIEHGERNPSVLKLAALAHAMGLTVAQILEGVE
jgi:transcriptional regulator with XRE-family HTH domain